MIARRIARCNRLNALVVLVTLSSCAAADTADIGAGVQEDLLVKFDQDSGLGRHIDAAFDQPRKLTPRLAAFTRELATALDMPLHAVRIASGRELVLGLDRDQLRKSLQQFLESQLAIATVETRPDSGIDAPARIRISFPAGSEGETVLSNAIGNRDGHESAMNAFVRGILDDYPYPVLYQPAAPDMLDLTVDIPELVDRVARFLVQRSDVLYAQKNLRATPM